MTTPNLGLSSTTEAAGASTTFLTWRLLQDGDTASNMLIIDTWAGTVDASLTTLSTGVVYSADATTSDNLNYTATISAITTYTAGTIINIIPDSTNTGSPALVINALAAKSLKKTDGTGAAVNLIAGDLVTDRYSLFIYVSAGYWLLMSGTSGDQVNVQGTDDDIVVLTDNGLVSSGISISDIVSGAASVTDESLAVYDDTTGKLLKGGPAPGSEGNIIRSTGSAWETSDSLKYLVLDAATVITASTGVITATQSLHTISPESGTADDIDTISGLVAGQVAVFSATNPSTDTITIKDGTGNISCFGDADIELTGGILIATMIGSTVYVAGGGGGGGATTDYPVIKDAIDVDTTIESGYTMIAGPEFSVASTVTLTIDGTLVLVG